jgi:hypothetical protein
MPIAPAGHASGFQGETVELRSDASDRSYVVRMTGGPGCPAPVTRNTPCILTGVAVGDQIVTILDEDGKTSTSMVRIAANRTTKLTVGPRGLGRTILWGGVALVGAGTAVWGFANLSSTDQTQTSTLNPVGVTAATLGSTAVAVGAFMLLMDRLSAAFESTTITEANAAPGPRLVGIDVAPSARGGATTGVLVQF